MKFNEDILVNIQSLFKKNGFILKEKSNFQLKFVSKRITIVFIFNAREMSHTLWVKVKNVCDIEVDNKVMKDFFHSNLKISELPAESFINNAFLFFNEEGKDLLNATDNFIASLVSYSEQRSSNFTNNLINRQNLESAANAWYRKDYKGFLDSLSRVNKNNLTESLNKKSKIANRKLKICAPISLLVKELKNIGYIVVDKKVSDYHFHEIYIKMRGGDFDKSESIKINGIDKIDSKTFSCSCHWSIVELCDTL